MASASDDGFLLCALSLCVLKSLTLLKTCRHEGSALLTHGYENGSQLHTRSH